MAYNKKFAARYLNTSNNPSLACSVNHPVNLLSPYRSQGIFRFLEGVIPQQLRRQLLLADARPTLHTTQNGMGNMRIKPAGTPIQQAATYTALTPSQLADQLPLIASQPRQYEPWHNATPILGRSPKLLIQVDNKNMAGPISEELKVPAQQYLVKLARQRYSNRSSRALSLSHALLHIEYLLYKEVEQLGLDTPTAANIQFHRGKRGPSLWLPRFDVNHTSSGIKRYGLETLDSLLNCNTNTPLNHFDVVTHTIKKLEHYDFFDKKQFISEWLKRDFLRVAIGSHDNHGRKHTFIKGMNTLRLAPIYGLVPDQCAALAPSRTITWGAPFEMIRGVQWLSICDEIERNNPCVRSEFLQLELKILADQLLGLASRLKERGALPQILEHPKLPFQSLKQRMKSADLI